MRTRTSKFRAATVATTLLAAFALLVGSAAMSPVSAQADQADARWRPWLGCWEPVGALDAVNGRMLCVLPVEGSAAVELATVDSGRVLVRERVVTDGKRMKSEQGGCQGWKSASWSPSGEQLYLHSEFDCEGGLKRTSTGIFAMAPGGIWLDVRGVSANDGGGVRVIRYRSAEAPDVLRDELARVTADRELALSTARTAATGSVSLQDVIDASHAVDPAVVQAWLIERRQNFAVDAEQLEQLADAGVPGKVIDAMVALSYPKVFAIAGSEDIGMRADEVAMQDEERTGGRTIISTMMYPYGYGYYGYSPFDYFYSPFAYSPYGYGFGFGWYPSGAPVVIIRNPDNVGARSHGRMVKGRGYVRDGAGDSGGSTRRSVPRRSRGDSPSTSSGSSSRGTSSASPSAGSSGRQSTGRTAKPRKP